MAESIEETNVDDVVATAAAFVETLVDLVLRVVDEVDRIELVTGVVLEVDRIASVLLDVVATTAEVVGSADVVCSVVDCSVVSACSVVEDGVDDVSSAEVIVV